MRLVSPDAPTAEDGPAGRSLGTTALLALGLLWLAAMLWSAHASIASTEDPSVIVASAALALPMVVAASLLGGGAAGLTVADRFATAAGLGRRTLVGLAGGLASGIFAAGVILIAYGARTSVVVLAATVGGASVLGGALGALRPAAALAGGLAATLAVFVADVIVKLFQSPLKSLFGAGATLASQMAAADRLSLTLSIVSGLVAGLTAWAYLRRRGAGLRWPAHLLAGAAPGLLMLIAEVVTRIGGARLLASAGGLSAEDRDVLSYIADSRVNHGLVVTFLGGIAALIFFGRSLPPRDLDEAEPDAAQEPSGEPSIS